MYVYMCGYVQKMVMLCVLYRARLGFQVRLKGSARMTEQDYKVRVLRKCCVCVCSHMREHACVLAAGTLVTVTNLCLQNTLKMFNLT